MPAEWGVTTPTSRRRFFEVCSILRRDDLVSIGTRQAWKYSNLLNSVKRPHYLIEGIQRLLYIAHMSEEASQRFEDKEVPHNLNSPDGRRPFLEEMDEY